MNAFVIDAFKYCRLHERREGTFMVSELPRLLGELADTSGAIHWVLQGGESKLGYSQLMLSIVAFFQLNCQRCLMPLSFDVSSISNLILAKDEVQADEIEALLAEEDVDVIVAGEELDLVGLIEDEVLLAMPFSPKHDVCLDRTAMDLSIDAEKASPFSSLKNFKQ